MLFSVVVGASSFLPSALAKSRLKSGVWIKSAALLARVFYFGLGAMFAPVAGPKSSVRDKVVCLVVPDEDRDIVQDRPHVAR